MDYAKDLSIDCPILPRLAELWQTVAATGESISYVANLDESKLVEDEIEIVVQIKGKVRCQTPWLLKIYHGRIARDWSSWWKEPSEIDGKDIVKVISVPSQLC